MPATNEYQAGAEGTVDFPFAGFGAGAWGDPETQGPRDDDVAGRGRTVGSASRVADRTRAHLAPPGRENPRLCRSSRKPRADQAGSRGESPSPSGSVPRGSLGQAARHRGGAAPTCRRAFHSRHDRVRRGGAQLRDVRSAGALRHALAPRRDRAAHRSTRPHRSHPADRDRLLSSAVRSRRSGGPAFRGDGALSVLTRRHRPRTAAHRARDRAGRRR